MKRHRVPLITVLMIGLQLLIGLCPADGVSAQAAPPEAPNTSTDHMNDIKRSQFGDFEKKWKLVTVRFRRDTGELRFTYANAIAWNILSSSRTGKPIVYPAGAVFAKVGLATKEDPAFTSSAVPSGARRVQFMVRNQKKYRDTDGWGYALFDGGGRTFPGDLSKASAACAACHRIVPERGYVFSQIIGHETLSQTGAMSDRVDFEDIDSAQLPERIVLHIPAKSSMLRKWTGEITRHVFPGTLDEARPTLAKEAIKSTRPALLLSDDHQSFSIVYVSGRTGGCGANKVEIVGITSVDGGEKTQSISYCESGP